MEKHGFEIKKHHLLETAWLATFTHRMGGRTVGVNSEMDALPGIGHACGHNLIAISGVAVAIAVKNVLQQFDIPGKIALLGTPGASVSVFAEDLAVGLLTDRPAHQVRRAVQGRLFC